MVKKSFKENILYITYLKNNKPNVDNLEKVLDEYDVYPVTLEESNVKLWRILGNKFELYKEVPFVSDIPNFSELNKIYDDFFKKYNINRVFLKFYNNEIYKFTKNSQKIVPIVYANDNNIPINYGFNSEALLSINEKDNSYETDYFDEKKGVVFTAIFGDYEELLEPEYIDENLDYICFTDNKHLKSEIWEIRIIDDLIDLNNTMKARTVKILPHKYLTNYDYSLWVDAGFKIIGDLRKFLKLYSTDKPLLTIKHSERDCIYSEGRICSNLKKDDLNIIKSQMDKYHYENYPSHNGLVESGIMFRKHNLPQVIKVMEDWYAELINFSKRDQLSFNYVCWKNKFEFDMIDFYCWKNPFFEHYFHQISKIDYIDKITDLRIIILDNNNEIKLKKSVDAIKDINKSIPISIITTNNNLYYKNLFNEISINYSKKYIQKINEIITEINEDYIFICRAGDIIKYDSIKELISLKKDSNLAAIVFDDISYDGVNKITNFKPGFSPDLYLEYDYIHDSIIFNRKFLLMEGKFNESLKTYFMRDMLLRLCESNFKIVKSDVIGLEIKNNFKIQKNENIELLETVLNHRECDFKLNFDDEITKPIYNPSNKKVSIIIPFKDQPKVTKTCVESILNKTDYENYEIILVNNNSYNEETFQYLETIENNDKIKIIDYPFSFNYSKINNYASKYADGEILLFLNNDTEVILENWLSILVGDAIQKGVGAVGAKLYYPDMKTVQHAGVGIGLTHIAGHYFMIKPEKIIPDIYNKYRRNILAVTGACLAIKKSIFDEVNGFNERFDIAFSDVELCLKIFERGYRIIYNPNVTLIHHEMKTRGKKELRDKDRILFYDFAKEYLENGDPYINKNISLNSSMLDKVREENECPNFRKFWYNFSKEITDKKQSIKDSISELHLNDYYNLVTNEDLIKNGFLMDSFFKDPYLKLDKVSWFIEPDNLENYQLDSIFEIAHYLSKYEQTLNYFIIHNLNKELESDICDKIGSRFSKMNYKFVSDENNLPPVDAGICTDSKTAYQLVRFNDCKCKFYFVQKDESYGRCSLDSIVINQSNNFDFIGITNNISLYNKYKSYNRYSKCFNTFSDRNTINVYRKNHKIKLIFYGKPSDDLKGFEMGVNVLKIIKYLFKDRIEIYSFGEDYDPSEFDIVDEITNLGILTDEELQELYLQSDMSLLFMFSSEVNPIILDMMACGCVVVTNKNINHSHLMLDKENCILCEPQLSCIVENIFDLINDDVLRERIMKNSTQYVRKFKNYSEINKIINFMKHPIVEDYSEKNKKLSINKYEQLLHRNCILTETKNKLANENISLKSNNDFLFDENKSLKQNYGVLNEKICSLKSDYDLLSEKNDALKEINENLTKDNISLNKELVSNRDYDAVNNQLYNQITLLKEENENLAKKYELILNSNSWKVTKFLRVFRKLFSK